MKAELVRAENNIQFVPAEERRFIPLEEMRQQLGLPERREWYERPAHRRKMLASPGRIGRLLAIHERRQAAAW